MTVQCFPVVLLLCQTFKKDYRLYDETKYLYNHRWAYFNNVKHGYLCKACEVVYGDKPCAAGRAWSHNAVILKDNPGKMFKLHENSTTHTEASLVLTNAKIEASLTKADKEIRDTKSKLNTLYISKLLKITHFLTFL